MTLLSLATIRLDGDTQPRESIDLVVVAEYAEEMEAGASFPPVVVFHDGAAYWLADGFHRYHAARRLGVDTIAADVRLGTVEDARWYSYSTNKDHGLRRTNEDKRRAVLKALGHPQAATIGIRGIARHCGVSEGLVHKLFHSSVHDEQIDTPRTVTRNGVTYEMNTANIGRRDEPHFEYVPFVPTAADYADPYGDELDDIAAPDSRVLVVEPRESHQLINQSTNNEWYTPARFVDAARQVMGGIDLDPASCAYANETVGAARYYTIDDNGYIQPWYGRVWLNPPYGRDDTDNESNQARWSRKLLEAYRAGNVEQAILLVNAVPGNQWFAPLKNFPICFPDSRIRFYNETTEAGQPTHSNALVYFGPNIAAFVRAFSVFGRVMGPLVAEGDYVSCSV